MLDQRHSGTRFRKVSTFTLNGRSRRADHEEVEATVHRRPGTLGRFRSNGTHTLSATLLVESPSAGWRKRLPVRCLSPLLSQPASPCVHARPAPFGHQI